MQRYNHELAVTNKLKISARSCHRLHLFHILKKSKLTWVQNVENSLHPKRIKSRAKSFSPLACFDSCTLADWALIVMTVRCQAQGCWDGETWTSCTLRELLRLETHTLFLQLLPRCHNSPGHLICWRIWHGFRQLNTERDGIEVWKMAFSDCIVFPIHLLSGWWDMIHDFTSIWKTYEATFTRHHHQEMRADKSRYFAV